MKQNQHHESEDETEDETEVVPTAEGDDRDREDNREEEDDREEEEENGEDEEDNEDKDELESVIRNRVTLGMAFMANLRVRVSYIVFTQTGSSPGSSRVSFWV